MPRPKYLDRIEETERRATVLLLALNAVVNEQPAAVEECADDRYPMCHYEFRLYRAQAPHGGILVRIFSAPNQSPHVEASYFDDARAAFRDQHDAESLPHRIALDRLAAVRARLHNAELTKFIHAATPPL